jgi:hypothetical protein
MLKLLDVLCYGILFCIFLHTSVLAPGLVACNHFFQFYAYQVSAENTY